MLQEEAISSGKQNAAIEMRWAELLELNMPQQLYSEIEAQARHTIIGPHNFKRSDILDM